MDDTCSSCSPTHNLLELWRMNENIQRCPLLDLHALCTGRPVHAHTLTCGELSRRQEGDLISFPVAAASAPSALQGYCTNNLPLATMDARLVLRGAACLPHMHPPVLIRENTRLHLDACNTKRSRQELPLAAATEMIIRDLFHVCVCAPTCVCMCEGGMWWWIC